MPLTSTFEKPVFKRDGVAFLTKDGPHRVPCQIFHHDLLSFFGTVSMNDAALIFAAYREMIERAASEKGRLDAEGRVGMSGSRWSFSGGKSKVDAPGQFHPDG